MVENFFVQKNGNEIQGEIESFEEINSKIWDLEADNYRVFNWNSVESDPKEFSIDESYFT